MQNLLKETLEMLAENGKSPADVRWVGHRDFGYLTQIRPTPEKMPYGSWEEFVEFADFDYDNGYGGAQVSTRLVIVGDDWWLERGEYDGSEWWEFKTLPKPPVKRLQMRESDLRDRF
jgi:hypothetical protein